uniref:Uncharacterized protein n=1 Tax=viral metagenome TaxID=1070528 RepID=A0A6H1ZGD4_9ZZZZ
MKLSDELLDKIDRETDRFVNTCCGVVAWLAAIMVIMLVIVQAWKW